MKRETKIKKQFDTQGREIAKYIRQNSKQNAQNFINEVDKLTNEIEQTPKAYTLEPYLLTENNLYRFAIVSILGNNTHSTTPTRNKKFKNKQL